MHLLDTINFSKVLLFQVYKGITIEWKYQKYFSNTNIQHAMFYPKCFKWLWFRNSLLYILIRRQFSTFSDPLVKLISIMVKEKELIHYTWRPFNLLCVHSLIQMCRRDKTGPAICLMKTAWPDHVCWDKKRSSTHN